MKPGRKSQPAIPPERWFAADKGAELKPGVYVKVAAWRCPKSGAPPALQSMISHLLQLLDTDTFALTARANSALLLCRFAVTFNGQNGRDRIGSVCR
jgi:hypothetical protein